MTSRGNVASIGNVPPSQRSSQSEATPHEVREPLPPPEDKQVAFWVKTKRDASQQRQSTNTDHVSSPSVTSSSSTKLRKAPLQTKIYRLNAASSAMQQVLLRLAHTNHAFGVTPLNIDATKPSTVGIQGVLQQNHPKIIDLYVAQKQLKCGIRPEHFLVSAPAQGMPIKALLRSPSVAEDCQSSSLMISSRRASSSKSSDTKKSPQKDEQSGSERASKTSNSDDDDDDKTSSNSSARTQSSTAS